MTRPSTDIETGQRLEGRSPILSLDGRRVVAGASLELKTADGWIAGRLELGRDGRPRLSLTSFDRGGRPRSEKAMSLYNRRDVPVDRFIASTPPQHPLPHPRRTHRVTSAP